MEGCQELAPQTNDDHLVRESAAHRYLRRKEDDQDNAAYWYGRAGKPVFPETTRCGIHQHRERFARGRTTVERSLFRAVFFEPKPFFIQQLNPSRWLIYCDHSVTSADVRLSVDPNLTAVSLASDRSISHEPTVVTNPLPGLITSSSPTNWELLDSWTQARVSGY
jgi:hypothetical protein